MNRRQLVLLGVSFLVAAAMAYYLQDIVRSVLFVPVSYLWWGVNILYQSVAQLVYWVLLVVGVTLMAFGSLYGKDRDKELIEEESNPSLGPLEATARQISRTGKEGVYYKWLIANRMGRLARSILSLRNGQADAPNNPLKGRDWNPPDEVAAYLESGLTRTFADFPRQRRFSRPLETPFDLDLNQVIAYLESQMENHRD
ncbi:MAG: hypothetical protein JW963_25810 [Anaerolineales bacterium]|nr:hypothetical protein [Anaerolineales bacterium]